MAETWEPNTCIRGCCISDGIPLRVASTSYSLLSPIARGSESTVYDASLCGKRVAAKKPALSTSADLDKFHRELQLLCMLDHPGLARLLAAHAWPPNYMFFFEFYEAGNLAQKLHADEWSPTAEEALVIALDIAEALHYLHMHGIVHRDVKPANILLDRYYHAHLADFGLSIHQKYLKTISSVNWTSSGKPTGGFYKNNMVGTLIYMAPEILKKDVHTEKSDVYSFAISINELLTGVVPYTDLRTEAQAHTVLEMRYTEQQLTTAIVSDSLRPTLVHIDSTVPSALASLIKRCWDPNPIERPSFDDIILQLQEMINDIKRTPIIKEDCEINLSFRQISQNFVKDVQCLQENINWASLGEHCDDIMPKSVLFSRFVQGFSNNLPNVSFGSFATRGMREKMEDEHFLLPQIGNEKDVHVFGIFDGHRGSEAAEFSARALPRFLQTLYYDRSPSEALYEAFIKTDTAFRNELLGSTNTKRKNENDCHPGCTAIVAMIVKHKLFVSNAGDCRAILCRNYQPFSMSKDHVASCPDERMRITEAGVEVKWQVDTWRVGEAAIQVTRSIGDDDLKPAVTAEPEIIETSLLPSDDFFVMASDGLWDALSNDQVVSIVKDTVKEPTMCSKRLATEAVERGSKDNITVIVVFLQPVSTAERIF